MTFLRPDLWWIGALAVVVVAVARRLGRRRVLAVTTFSFLSEGAYRASRLRRLPVAFVWLALALVFVALLQPVIPIAERQVQQRGLDIVLVVDLSLSTSRPIGFQYGNVAPPVTAGPTRLDAMKTALKDFIGRRPNDRIGVVVFSDHAYVVSPMTFDEEHLLGYFNLLDPETLKGEGMTAIGDGIDMASFLLNRQSTGAGPNKIVIVFTDGANNMGRDPVVSLEEATAAGYRVHVVGVDLEEEQKWHPSIVQLIEAVRRNGGRYYAAGSTADLDAASRGLDQIEKGLLTTKIYTHSEPAARWFSLAAIGMLLIALGLRVLPIFIGLH